MQTHEAGHLPKHQRSLNVFMLAMLSLAVVISLRNLPLTAEYGLSSIFFYLVAAITFMIPYALISAELASGWPKAGGVYIWVRTALGDRWGFFAIWMQWFHNMTWYPAMLSFIAAGIAYLFDPELATNKLYLITVILTGFWGVTFLNFLGIKTSALISTICVIIGAIIPGLLLIVLGVWWMASGKPLSIHFVMRDLIPDFSHLSNFVFLAGIFLALSGLEANANLAREVKNPQKNYPRAILIAALMTLIILIFGSLAIAIVIPQKDINLVSGLLDAFRSFFAIYNLRWLVPIVAIFTVFGALGELNAWTIAGVKGLFVTTEHGCLPPLFHKINKNHTPVNLMFFQAIIVTIAAFIFLYLPNINIAYWMLNALAAQMYILMYLLLLASGIVLRYRKPHVNRAYRIPFGNTGMWIAVIIGAAASLFAMIVSFFPPIYRFQVESVLRYEILLIGGLLISCLVPLVIYSFRKPHWQTDVLSQIREEIHKSTH
ncbi:MAG: Glutamate/gamma-aminobutyrate antiporter [Chlamydiales bacterium]|nr:Glutamate/gamma-aminobutyrate antiporter [Chlamydiales bacterium]MCH9620163.1 Glutamate/gamma-aminobutyrate antiporter [Chlamydiales bacterium]MCH9623633.1 Glutamate/gamma-aminobutyrate antiporter [Chlamydiales bacterium]